MKGKGQVTLNELPYAVILLAVAVIVTSVNLGIGSIVILFSLLASA